MSLSNLTIRDHIAKLVRNKVGRLFWTTDVLPLCEAVHNQVTNRVQDEILTYIPSVSYVISGRGSLLSILTPTQDLPVTFRGNL